MELDVWVLARGAEDASDVLAGCAKAQVGSRRSTGPVTTARQEMEATARIFWFGNNMELTYRTRVTYIVCLFPMPAPVEARRLQHGVLDWYLCPAELVKQPLTDETTCPIPCATGLAREMIVPECAYSPVWNRAVATGRP